MDDLISRQAAIDAVSRGCQEFRGIFAECEKNLNRLPSAERHGRWEPVQYGCVCSVCGKRKEQFSDNFCANCGAKMKGHFEEPEINPCRGCEDYDGKGGCISNGGCGASMDEVTE